jgi:lipopolysaccharide/colanic/teichoic acid biosynthesis glycosyltransferase
MSVLSLPASTLRRATLPAPAGPNRRQAPGAPASTAVRPAPHLRLVEQKLRDLTHVRTRAWYEKGGNRWTVPASYIRIKRAIDVVVSLLLLPFALPVIAICMAIVKLDSPGPALIGQPRTGKGGRTFRMLKLRTMVQNAHELKAKYMHLNELSYPDFKITNDPRLTRCGRVLRKLSLDELPQILNVLRGEMTLVGPRPTSFGPETYRLWHTARLDVTPGLTGLWQVSGRAEVDFDDRLRLDIAYIRNRCLWLDLQILLRTAGAVLSRKGAN